MSEVVAWPEGQISIYTGAGATSAIVSYAAGIQMTFQRGWFNTQSIDGTYRNHLTGQRVDLNISRFYNYDGTFVRIIESATAVHIKALHTALGLSAGYFLYSGQIASHAIAAQGGMFTFDIQYYANAWSAFG